MTQFNGLTWAAVIYGVRLFALVVTVAVVVAVSSAMAQEAQKTREFNMEDIPGGRKAQEKTREFCIEGPDFMRQVDARELEDQTTVRIGGVAEAYISRCVSHLSILSEKYWRWPGVIKSYQTNLEFMKWWLKNRREKGAK